MTLEQALGNFENLLNTAVKAGLFASASDVIGYAESFEIIKKNVSPIPFLGNGSKLQEAANTGNTLTLDQIKNAGGVVNHTLENPATFDHGMENAKSAK